MPSQEIGLGDRVKWTSRAGKNTHTRTGTIVQCGPRVSALRKVREADDA